MALHLVVEAVDILSAEERRDQPQSPPSRPLSAEATVTCLSQVFKAYVADHERATRTLQHARDNGAPDEIIDTLSRCELMMDVLRRRSFEQLFLFHVGNFPCADPVQAHRLKSLALLMQINRGMQPSWEGLTPEQVVRTLVSPTWRYEVDASGMCHIIAH
jgi:hypothetical protein